MKRTAALTMAFIFSLACAHQKNIHPGKFQTYDDSVKNLNLHSSFAFQFQGHNYYFVSSSSIGYVDSCARFDVYKDNQLTFSFPRDRLEELEEVYSSKLGVEMKIEQAAKWVESVSPPIFDCVVKTDPKKPFFNQLTDAAGEATTFIVYGGMAVIVLPFWGPIALADSYNENRLDRKLRQIRLGDTEERVQKIMDSSFQKEDLSQHVVETYEFASSNQKVWKRLVFVYNKDQKLVAYVWGLRP